MPDQPINKNLSRLQYGDLQFIRNHRVTMAHLRKANATTFNSLAYRGLICRTGAGEEAEVILTPAGEEAYLDYRQAGLNERTREGEVRESTMKLLQYARRMAMNKGA